MTNRRGLTAGAALLLSVTTACGSSETTTAPGVSQTTLDPAATTASPATTLLATTLPANTLPGETTTAPPVTTLPAATTLPATTTAPTSTTTTTLPAPPAPAPCGVFPAIPAGALEINTALIDTIGDGTADDIVTSYLDPAVTEWRLRLELPTGSTSELVVTGIGAGFLKVLGAAQVDGGGADEFLAVAGSGASSLNLGAFGATSDGCLFRFTQDGATFVAPVGATVTHQDGLSCTGTGLVLGHAEVSSGTMWEVSSTSLSRVSDTDLSAVTSSIAVVDEADVGTVAVLNCSGLSL